MSDAQSDAQSGAQSGARIPGKSATDKNGVTATAIKKEIRKGPKLAGTVILVVVALGAVIGGSLWAVNTIGYVGTDDAAIDGKQVKLSSRMLGRISAILATEGQQVKQGDVLVTLDATDLHAQEAQAQASLAFARQNLVLSKISLDKTRDDSVRIQGLYKNGATTRENYDHSISALDAAQAQYTLAQTQVDTAIAQIGVIKAQLLNTSLATPISGTVDKISMVSGDVVQPGQAILSVNNLDDIWVTANLEETKINRIAIGSAVTMTVDAFGGRVFHGTVELIRAGIVAPAFQIGDFTKTTQRVPIKIRFTDPITGITLLPGMSVVVKIRTTASLPAFAGK
ncbi:MAG TPA: HlyD family secretion protein [bacterium]|nr:HlyD family secretion protein [bacterium]